MEEKRKKSLEHTYSQQSIMELIEGVKEYNRK